MYICLCPEWLSKVMFMLRFVLLSVNRWIFILHFQLAWLRSNRAQKNVRRTLFTTFFGSLYQCFLAGVRLIDFLIDWLIDCMIVWLIVSAILQPCNGGPESGELQLLDISYTCSSTLHDNLKKINIFIEVTETRVFVVYPMWVYHNRYDRLAVQFCLRVNRLNPCYAWFSHV